MTKFSTVTQVVEKRVSNGSATPSSQGGGAPAFQIFLLFTGFILYSSTIFKPYRHAVFFTGSYRLLKLGKLEKVVEVCLLRGNLEM